jgi:Domain of unknown function (DUF4345)
VKPEAEHRLFQLLVFIGALVPISAGAAGVIQGSEMIHGPLQSNADLDSHFRYLSGLLLGIGIAYVTCIPNIERKRGIFAYLSLIVILGGCARLVAVVQDGLPTAPHRFAFVMELVVVPLLLLWSRRLGRLA